MNDKELYQTILGLSSPWRVERVEMFDDKKEIIVHVGRPSGEKVACPICGDASPVYDHVSRCWRHLDTCQYKTILSASVPRSNCATHGVHTIRVPWSDSPSRFTALFEALAIQWLQAASVSAAAERLGISWSEANGIMQRAVRRGLARREDEPVEYIGVDEKSFRKRHEYVTVVCDLSNGRVLDIAKDRKKESLEGLLRGLSEKQRSSINGVAMDMWEPYVQAVDSTLPLGRSKIVFDKFHIAKHLNEGVDKVRRDESKSLAARGDERLKGTRYQWLKNPNNFTSDQWKDFKTLRDSNMKVARAWSMKETIMNLWDYCYEGSARRFFKSWLKWVNRSGLSPMKKVGAMMRDRLDNIMTYLSHRITNAMSEGVNSKIQWIKYMARGYRNIENYRTAILFHCGGLKLMPETHRNS